jgi:hypothetical protein
VRIYHDMTTGQVSAADEIDIEQGITCVQEYTLQRKLFVLLLLDSIHASVIIVSGQKKNTLLCTNRRCK